MRVLLLASLLLLAGTHTARAQSPKQWVSEDGRWTQVDLSKGGRLGSYIVDVPEGYTLIVACASVESVAVIKVYAYDSDKRGPGRLIATIKGEDAPLQKSTSIALIDLSAERAYYLTFEGQNRGNGAVRMTYVEKK